MSNKPRIALLVEFASENTTPAFYEGMQILGGSVISYTPIVDASEPIPIISTIDPKEQHESV